MIQVVLQPSHLRGAKVVDTQYLPGFMPYPQNPEGINVFFVLDRLVPSKGEPMSVASEDVVVAWVPPCCWAAETAEPAERLYAAYNLGGPIERAGKTWDGELVPTWAALLEQEAHGMLGAAGVVAKWRAVVELGKNFCVFNARHVHRLPVHAEGLASKPVGTVVHHPQYGEGVVVVSDYWAWVEEYPVTDLGLPVVPVTEIEAAAE